ncbi:MAG: DUF3137 domain-containing protein [Muricauda sp.]|nr:DUF3137 domain-containing protein [Allomuricauda sp.]MBA4746829.1 DUF3137 domain-containing protein [Allomuricauda sp.]
MVDFSSIKKQLLPLLEKAEPLRKKYRRYKTVSSLFMLLFLSSIIVLPLLSYLFSYNFIEWFGGMHQNEIWLTSLQMPMFFLIGVFYVIYAMANSQKRKYMAIEKEILETLLEKIVPTFHFDANKQIDVLEIANSELLSQHNPFVKDQSLNQVYNMNQGVLSGKVGSTSISMGNVKTVGLQVSPYLMYIPFYAHIYMTYTYLKPWLTKEKSIDEMGSGFTGMFATMDFNKKFNGTTVVLPDQYEKRIGYMAKTLQSMNLGRDQLVNMEDTEFENEFVVYSTDQTEARYILSPSLMQRIIAFKKKVGSSVLMSFKNDKLYMAVQLPHGFLSLRQNQNLVTSNVLELFYEDITMAIGIVEDLNLNTKIWKN